MSQHAVQPHGLAPKVLAARSEVLSAAYEGHGKSASPWQALRQYLAPVKTGGNAEIYCATCHKEHNGEHADLRSVTDARCHTCHQVQFASFAKTHPEFRSYPFRRPTRITFDHAQHFTKHFPQAISRKINLHAPPKQCLDCHTTRIDDRHMSVKSFDETCASCHRKQILGDERASGPKGIAFFALPGLDVETLKAKGFDVGAWPTESEADLPAILRLLIGVDERRRRALQRVDGLDLLDLSKASKQQLAAVVSIAWEVKALLHEMMTRNLTSLERRIEAAVGERTGRKQLARLTASLPRDVLITAARTWLPTLDAEMQGRVGITNVQSAGSRIAPTRRLLPPGRAAASPQLRPEAQRRRVAQNRARPAPARPADSWFVNPFGELVKGKGDAEARRRAREAERRAREEDRTSNEVPPDREPKTESAKSAPALQQAPADDNLAISAEDWSTLGGWYRQDYAIYYRPARHADAFLRMWLNLASRAAAQGSTLGGADTSLSRAVFEDLTAKDAPGTCSKCHSVETSKAGHPFVNWRPATFALKLQRATRFKHELHLAIVGKQGCLHCHAYNEMAPSPQTKASGAAVEARSNFKSVAKATCAACHTENKAPQNCTHCHNYHVRGVTTATGNTPILAGSEKGK